MAPIDLNLIRTFATLYETGSFTRAAKRLGVPRSTVSRAIAALEEQVGDELVHRTTRLVAISAEGKELYDRVSPSLVALGAALADRPERQDEPTGLLKITATQDVSASLLSEAAVRFATRYPQTQVEILVTTQLLDLTRDGIDFAVRIVSGRMPDSTNVVQRLGTVTWQLFAAPSFLARRGTPRALKDIPADDWVGFKGVTPAPRTNPHLNEGRIVSDDIFVAREMLRRGGGIGGLPVFLAADDLQAGTLVAVLPKVALISAPVYLVRPARKHVASRVTAFKELLTELLRQRPLT